MKINIPTAISKREAELLRQLGYNKNVLEIGSLLGFSTINLGKVAKKITSIDPHEEYPFNGAESTYYKFKNNLMKYNINNIIIIKNKFENINIKKYDMVFIDLDGKYKTTKNVLNATKHIPLVLIHDFDRQNCSGVRKAIKQNNSKIIQVIDTCAIIRN